MTDAHRADRGSFRDPESRVFYAGSEDFGEAAVRDMRVKGLSAFLLPGPQSGRPPSNLNTVNTFRFLFDQYFGSHFPLLSNASYPEGDLPYDFKPMRVK